MFNYIIIDFDSTLINLESLEHLAALTLQDNPDKDLIYKQLVEITNRGMEGKIPFDESLEQRLQLFNSHKDILEVVIEEIKLNITPSFLRNIDFLKANADKIIIISGGFKEMILPVIEILGLNPENVYANTFIYDLVGNIVGVDKDNYLAQQKGKVKQVRALELLGNIAVIGDGYTDYQIKEEGLASKFFAFTEIISREKVVNVADQILKSFDEFIKLYQSNIQVPILESYEVS